MLAVAALALELGISVSRSYQLRTDYLRACAQGLGETWSPVAPEAIITWTGPPK